MAVGQGYSKTATNGLVFAYDTGDTRNSFLGRPTTNLMEGYGLSNYNNVGGSVTTTLSQTTDSYRGTPVWIQTLTPLDGSGVSWLSNGNNPGLGVVSSGGGGLANRYTGHSIFFKPTVPMHSSPIFTNYSNIAGWQSCCNYEDMGDGWFRAKVLWYDTTTRSDGKYWAINPLSATLNTPITIYWAGPFKEDLNSQYISQYTPTSRSNTGSLLELTGTYTLNSADVSFDSNVQITFDGTNDCIITSTSNFNKVDGQELTVEVIMEPGRNAGQYQDIVVNRSDGQYNWMLYQHATDGSIQLHGAGQYKSSYIPTIGQYIHVVATVTSGQVSTLYVNGVVQQTTAGFNYANMTPSLLCIGVFGNSRYEPYLGNIDVVKIYNRALTAGEIKQNYGHYKTRFNLP
jgi:hypothetical protein